ncbi:MAG: hypothetical protein R6W90_02115 [Ignavibacteriaceae bacterium]
MQNKFIIPLAVLFFIIIFNGCIDEPLAPYSVPNPIQPLAVGNEWIFTDSVFVMDGVSVGTTRIIVSGVTLVSSGQLFFDWQVYGENTLLRTNLISTDEKSLWHHGEVVNAETLLVKKQWSKYPVNIGDTFTEPRYSYSAADGFSYTETWTWKCISKNYPVTLAGGQKINCIAFQTTDFSGAETTILYAENIGYAGWITKVNGVLVFKETLASYTLK